MRIRFAHVLPMVGRDTYLHGRGRMLGKLLGLVTVVTAEARSSTWVSSSSGSTTR